MQGLQSHRQFQHSGEARRRQYSGRADDHGDVHRYRLGHGTGHRPRAQLLPRLLLLVLAAIPAVVLAAASEHVEDDNWSTKYDRHFRKYTKHYFGPHVDWRWFKAQGIAESNLNPKARGPSGGRGIMQLLPATFKEIKNRNPHLLSIEDPRWNIAAGIYYDRKMFRWWNKDGLDFDQRLAFTFASYNAGFGRIRKAYRRAGGADEPVTDWDQVAPHSPSITRGYVKRIRGLMGVDQ